MIVYPFRIGGRVALFLEAYSGDPTEVATVTAAIRRMNHDASDYLDDAPSIAMTVQFQAAVGQDPAGWHVFIDPVAGPQFKSGFYGVDIWLDDGDVPTSRAIVQLKKAAKI